MNDASLNGLLQAKLISKGMGLAKIKYCIMLHTLLTFVT